MNFFYFLHDLSLSVEIWQAIRNTNHKHLLHMGHRFFAIIDDKIPGLFTITCCYPLLCLRIESVEHRPHNRIVTKAVVTPTPRTRKLWPKSTEASANCFCSCSSKKRNRTEGHGVPVPNSRHQQFLGFLPFVPIYVSKHRERKFLGKNFQFLNRRWKVLNSALNNKISIASGFNGSTEKD